MAGSILSGASESGRDGRATSSASRSVVSDRRKPAGFAQFFARFDANNAPAPVRYRTSARSDFASCRSPDPQRFWRCAGRCACRGGWGGSKERPYRSSNNWLVLKPKSASMPSTVGRPTCWSTSRRSAKLAWKSRVGQGEDFSRSAADSRLRGSASRPTSNPSGPRRAAMAAACPPRPSVQSTTTRPGRTSKPSNTSCKRTGSWPSAGSSMGRVIRRQLRRPNVAVPSFGGILAGDKAEV